MTRFSSRWLAARCDQRSGAVVADLLFSSLTQRSYCRSSLPPTTRRVSTTQGKPIRRKGEVEQARAQCTLPQQKESRKTRQRCKRATETIPTRSRTDSGPSPATSPLQRDLFGRFVTGGGAGKGAGGGAVADEVSLTAELGVEQIGPHSSSLFFTIILRQGLLNFINLSA